jgi:hypothetical protein
MKILKKVKVEMLENGDRKTSFVQIHENSFLKLVKEYKKLWNKYVAKATKPPNQKNYEKLLKSFEKMTDFIEEHEFS